MSNIETKDLAKYVTDVFQRMQKYGPMFGSPAEVEATAWILLCMVHKFVDPSIKDIRFGYIVPVFQKTFPKYNGVISMYDYLDELNIKEDEARLAIINCYLEVMNKINENLSFNF